AFVVLGARGGLSAGRAPDNWVEDINLVVCLIGITCIGALSLALNQSRLARSHRQEAMTDPLTVLPNRRAMYERHFRTLPRGTAVIAFDLDRFKEINDRFGHAVGDEVLRHFAMTLRSNVRPSDTVARIGGEEFV